MTSPTSGVAAKIARLTTRSGTEEGGSTQSFEISRSGQTPRTAMTRPTAAALLTAAYSGSVARSS